MPGALFCCLCCLSLCLRESAAFNLDVTETILKYGDNGSFFGFSVALHRQLSPQPVSWLLVGAPQAAALPGQKANRTGGLYACPLTHEINDCKRVAIDEGVDLKKESKENQWLGVSVKSQGPGGKIVTCAHLYEARNRVNESLETRDVIGRCYLLSEGLKVSDELDGGEWKFCEGRPQGHDRFGFCQQGVATGFTADRHYILFGAPGTYNWKGILFVTNIDSSDPDQLVYKTSEPSERVPGNAGDVALNSYLGFSLDSGKGIVKNNKLSFVTGAPRANHTGAVVILERDNVNQLVPEFILWGEKLTSSFGYSLAVVDLNGDGWMELVVGAPNFYDRKAGIGGVVYVYINQAGDWDNVHPIRLNGSYDSMFGITVGAVGDLNQDSFQDFAVGAPLDGDGKVYIYHGSSSGFAVKPAQILTGESVGIKMFGYSFSGGLDIDGNLYPDLLVGSLSDTVVLYRTRPVIHISRTVTISPQNVDLENMNCRHQLGICMDVKVCFSYTANPSSYSPPVTLEYTFDADTTRRQLGQASRVTFLGRKTTDPEHQYSGVVELPTQHARVCVKATLQLKDKIRDKLHPIVVVVSYNIKHPRAKRQVQGATLGPLMPVLNPMPPHSHKTEVNFLKQGCGEDKICQSNLQLSYGFCSRIDDSTFHPLPSSTGPYWDSVADAYSTCAPPAALALGEVPNQVQGFGVFQQNSKRRGAIEPVGLPLPEYSAVTSVEVIVRASITVKSTISNLFLKDSTTQIPVTVYLDPSVAVARGVPWWIILIAILAGIVVLGLLVSILWKLGFFKRTRYEEAKVPQYHAVKIPRQERQLFREEKTGTITKKDWVTNWNGNSDGHVPASA
ncbi:integrin alpha-7 [Sphaerodactylus townsendi]|uniref:integrin alpha-7 n=1 Tax=Sphaerodactylus townsendi TaxID=933632 RepID=UPI002026F039|nr:integrin alpha-7 [Sphaerodactylus townsendi]